MSTLMNEVAPGPLASFRALAAITRRARLPKSAAGYDDRDFAAAVEFLKGLDETERAEMGVAIKADIAGVAQGICEPEDVTRVKGLVDSMPEEMTDFIWRAYVAVLIGAERRGLVSPHADDERFTSDVRERFDEALAPRVEAMFDDRYLAEARIGLVMVPGFTWLFSAGIHLFRAFVYFFFWLFSKVRLGLAIIWLPAWILAAICDWVTVSFPWTFFALTAWLVRGDTVRDRDNDRLFGCWCFGSSVLARAEYARLRRFKQHRDLLDEPLVLLVPAVHALGVAVLGETIGLTPTPASPPEDPASPVSWGVRARWYAPHVTAVTSLGVLVGVVAFYMG